MLASSVVQDILKFAKSAGEEIKKQVDEALFEIDINGWDYQFESRSCSHYLRICCYMHIGRGKESYEQKITEINRQYELIQNILNRKISKSKYSNLRISVCFSAGI